MQLKDTSPYNLQNVEGCQVVKREKLLWERAGSLLLRMRNLLYLGSTQVLINTTSDNRRPLMARDTELQTSIWDWLMSKS